MHISGRVLLAGLIPFAACSAQVNTSQLATDVNLIAAGLGPVITALQTTPGVNPAVVAQAQAYLVTLQQDAKIIAAATANAPLTTVNQVVQDVQALASIVGTIPFLAPYTSVIQAATALLPVILAAAHAPVAGVAPATMSATHARAILSLEAHK